MLFIYIPVVIMVIFSFNSGDTVFNFVHFSGKAYDDFVHNSPFVKSIITSLFVAVVSTLISLVIGVAAAIGLSKRKPLTQKSWFGIANIPLINADVVTAVSLMIIFLLAGMKFGIGTLLFAHISFNVPYVLITVMPRLRKVDPSILEAAQDLGSKPYQILWKVVLPILKPAIITAAAIAFSMSFDDFIISYFTGGSQTNVSTFIYTAKKIKPFIYAFGTLLVAVIIFAILLWNVFQTVRNKNKKTAEELRNGNYKTPQFDRYYKKLNQEYLILNTKKVMYHSWRLDLWIQYWWIKLLIRIYALKNYGKRISRLEWKQYEIRNEIRNEKRYYSRLEKTKKQIVKVRHDLKKKSNRNDSKKKQRFKNQLIRLLDRKKELEAEIEWMENRDEKAARHAARIQRQIDRWKKEFEQGKQAKSLSKKDVVWYKKKIKGLEQWKLEIEEGKNHYRLRKTTKKLTELRDLKSNKIEALNTRLEVLNAQLYLWKDITQDYDKTISKSQGELEIVMLQAYRNHHLDATLAKVEVKILRIEKKVAHLQTKVDAKATKVLNLDSDGNDRPKIKNWWQKSWKTLGVLILALGAFSGLTVAYVKNNIYDLVVANWGEYIDPDLINKFQKTTGYKINYQTFDANETLYNKLYTFTYDLMVPSDYMVQKLAEENKLSLVDWSKLNIEKPSQVTSNYSDDTIKAPSDGATKEAINSSLTTLMSKSAVNQTDETTGSQYNILDYAVPYFWGDLTLVFNQNNTKLNNFLTNYGLTVDADSQVQPGNSQLDWQIIKAAGQAGLNVQLNNDPKNIFMIASEILYGRTNLKTKTEVDKAFDYLKDLIKNKKISLAEGDSLITTVEEGQFDIALMYNGDALFSQLNRDQKKSPVDFAYGRVKADNVTSPLDGTTINQRTNIYSDNMVIAKNAHHKQAAYDFMNFMYNAKNATTNSSYVGLASPLDSVLTNLSNTSVEDDGFSEYKNLYQPIAVDASYYSGTEPLAFINNNDVDAYLVKKFNDLLTSINF